MLKKENLRRVLDQLDAMKTDAMLVSDPMSIFYLTGHRIYPGERFLGLAIGKQLPPTLILNELFCVPEDDTLSRVYYADQQPLMPVLQSVFQKKSVLGVDKTLQARFLLPLMNSGIASRYVNASIAVDRVRARKTPEEIEKMRVASKVNDAAMLQFKKLLYTGVTEREVAEQTLNIYRSLGASGYSFEPIVSFGLNSTDPHHMPDDTGLKEGDLVLFDVGCIVDDYCSDMTRTYFYKGAPTEKQLEVYNLVLRASMEAEEMLKPGIVIADIDKKARDIISEGGYGAYFTHRLGHFIGLETHEFGDVSQANESLTEVGNIFSIEPGIYDPKTAGVRIEDLVVITEDGFERLNHLPKEAEVIG